MNLGGFNNYYGNSQMMSGWLRFLLPLVILNLILKGFALWKSARKGQSIWFVALLLVNSMGILPLIYILFNQDQKEAPKKVKKTK